MTAVVTNQSSQNKQYDADRLLKQLLQCVQECQKRYGGKTELATEFDRCVVGLCLTLEAVLLHGIRVKPQETIPNTTLKHMSDIVSNTLHIGSETPSFWPFLKKHLIKHEQDRYSALKHIWTDTGRGRAWIRSSLNERALERSFHILLSNEEILQIHYEAHAILRDQEKSSLLPNMAAGVGSILFAISIDKPDLNSGVFHKTDRVQSKSEPIIEAPILDTKDKTTNRKKKKVAKQFISFAEDDSSILSTSVPSTSSSSSDSYSASEIQSSKAMAAFSQLKDISEEHASLRGIDSESRGGNINSLRKLSIDISENHDKFFGNVPGSLTPVTQLEIGELTPVSVEINRKCESPDNSEEILEVPADISAILTAVEVHNKEELRKKQEKIDLLVKENEILKEQIKKYVDAIQMLETDTGDDDNDKSKKSEELDSHQQPNYKIEATLFEKKLIQVAEMHAELMDFNVSLQQALCKKDLLLEKLQSELNELRGPIAEDENPSETVRGNVHVWIPSAFLTGSGSSAHHVYQIFLRAGNDEWNIYRRYAQFHALHVDLKKLDPSVTTFDFPPKKSIGNKDSSIVEERRKRLQKYLRKIIAHWPELAHCNNRLLLEQHLPFFKDQKSTEHKHTSIFSPRISGTDDNHYTGL